MGSVDPMWVQMTPFRHAKNGTFPRWVLLSPFWGQPSPAVGSGAFCTPGWGFGFPMWGHLDPRSALSRVKASP